jgi:hypothetical protein
MLGRLNFVASSLVVLLTVATASADEDQCGLYLAISSTSTVEDTNWGLFAGKDYEANTEIGTPDVAIMMPHLRANTYIADEDEEDEKEGLGRIVDFFEEFFWVPDTAAAKYDVRSRLYQEPVFLQASMPR